jgi:hypothetical protein
VNKSSATAAWFDKFILRQLFVVDKDTIRRHSFANANFSRDTRPYNY